MNNNEYKFDSSIFLTGWECFDDDQQQTMDMFINKIIAQNVFTYINEYTEIDTDYFTDGHHPLDCSLQDNQNYFPIKKFNIGEIIRKAVRYETQATGRTDYAKEISDQLKLLAEEIDMIVLKGQNNE
jgi:hypothetical protein